MPAPLPECRPARPRSTYYSIAATSYPLLASLRFEPHFFQRCRPGVRVDQHQRWLLDPRPDPTRPDVLPDGSEHDAFVDELLDLVQQGLAFAAVGLSSLL